MNLQFKSELSGGDLFKKSFLFLIGFIVAMAAFLAAANNAVPAAAVVLYVLVIVGAFALQYVFLSTLVTAVSFNNERFSWQGSFGSYMAVNIKGILLTIVTFGIYGAWYTKELTDYLADSIKYPGREIEFRGEAKKLFKYMIFSLFLPCIALVAIIVPLFAAGQYNSGMMVVGFIAYFVGIFAICSVYYYFVYKWFIDFMFGEDEVVLEADLKETVLFLFGQFLLIIVTFGIYAFAAEVKIFAYFTNHITFTNASSQKRNLVFTGATKEGFWLILGQSLLCVITFGIYIPWAFANIRNWLISHVELTEI